MVDSFSNPEQQCDADSQDDSRQNHDDSYVSDSSFYVEKTIFQTLQMHGEELFSLRLESFFPTNRNGEDHVKRFICSNLLSQQKVIIAPSRDSEVSRIDADGNLIIIVPSNLGSPKVLLQSDPTNKFQKTWTLGLLRSRYREA